MINNYFLYINRDDLDRFLVENMIYPHNSKFVKRRSLSLTYDNCLLLTTKKLSYEDICQACNDGLIPSMVLMVSIDLSAARIVWKSDTDIMINNPISFSCVCKIYNVSEELPGFLFNNIYLFDSLISDKFFEFGEDKVSERISYDKEIVRELDDELKLWSKIQAFYCARFGYLGDEEVVKKKCVFKRNIDLDSFKYISDEPYSDFINRYYEKETKHIAKISLFDNVTTFLNDNYEQLILSLINNKTNNDEEWNKYSILYRKLFDFINVNDFLEKIFAEEIFFREKLLLNKIDLENTGNIAYLRQCFDNIGERIGITIFILSKILDKDIDSAKLYINNFAEHSEFEKELLSMYGLAKGMRSISVTIKKKPDILLFSFNKSKTYFDSYIKMFDKNAIYYQNRSYVFTCLMNYGFDFKIYDEKAELCFINKKLVTILKNKYNIQEKSINKKIIRGLKTKELHDLFLAIKREEK